MSLVNYIIAHGKRDIKGGSVLKLQVEHTCVVDDSKNRLKFVGLRVADNDEVKALFRSTNGHIYAYPFGELKDKLTMVFNSVMEIVNKC